MILTKKVNKDTVCVLDNYPNPTLGLRKSGKEMYGQHEIAAEISDGKLVVDENVLKKYGIGLDILTAVKEPENVTSTNSQNLNNKNKKLPNREAFFAVLTEQVFRIPMLIM